MKQLSHVELAKLTGGNTTTPVQCGDPDEVVEITGGEGDPGDQDHSNQDLIGG